MILPPVVFFSMSYILLFWQAFEVNIKWLSCVKICFVYHIRDYAIKGITGPRTVWVHIDIIRNMCHQKFYGHALFITADMCDTSRLIYVYNQITFKNEKSII